METAKSKGKRGIFWLAVGIIAVVLAIPIGSYVGQALIHLDDHSNVLRAQSNVQYIYGATGSGIAFAGINGTTTYDMPFNETVSYLLTNITAADLNEYSASQLNVFFGSNMTVNASLGFGTNSSNFEPFLNVTSSNVSEQNITLQPQYFTGNQSSFLMIRLSGVAQSYSITLQVFGNTKFSYLGPFSGEQVAYLISGIIVFVAAALESPWFDIEIMRLHKPEKKEDKKKGGRK